MSTASCALPQLLVATMEPAGALTHPHWLASRPDPKDLRMSSVDIQRRVKEISVPSPLPIRSCCIARLWRRGSSVTEQHAEAAVV
jgi:hypothetical protein